MIKVLAVDDESPIRQWIAFCISHFPGYSCLTANSAQHGLALWQEQRPQIVLSDIEMPGGSGLEMLERIRSADPGVYRIILTSHDDFRYARAALQQGTEEYILKTELTEESLHALLERARQAIEHQNRRPTQDSVSREHYLQSLAIRRSTGKIAFEELRRQGICLEKDTIMAIDCRSCAGTALLTEWLRPRPVMRNAIVFSLGTEQVLAVGNAAGCDVRALLQKELVPLLAQQADGCCGVSDPLGGPELLGKALNQAMYRARLDFYDPACKLFWSGVPEDISHESEQFHLEYMRLLMEQNFSAACVLLNRLSQVIRSRRPEDQDGVRALLASSLFSFLHFACDSQEAADAAAEQVKAQIAAAKSFAEIETAAAQCFAPVLARVQATAGMTLPIRRTVEYLEQHYADKVSLAEMAELAAFSPEHFSRVFSRETGVNYITYLNNLRMRHAAELLKTTDLKVYEVAERVGFSSLSYFSTAFKKKFGQNPYEYQLDAQRGSKT